MKPIPTWRQIAVGFVEEPSSVSSICMQQEIDALRQRVRELEQDNQNLSDELTLLGKVSKKLSEEVFALEAAHKCNVETIECQQDEIVALKEDIGGHAV